MQFVIPETSAALKRYKNEQKVQLYFSVIMFITLVDEINIYIFSYKVWVS